MKILNVFILTVFLFHFIFLVPLLSKIGPEFDELLTLNAGTFCAYDRSLFIEHSVKIPFTENRCLLIMLSPYIGFPMAFPMIIHHVFELESLLSFRIINIIVGYISFALIVCSIAKSKLFNKKDAFLLLIFLLLDPFFLLNSVSDRTAIMPLFIKSIAIFILLQQKLSKKTGILLGITSGIFIWTKLDGAFLLFSLFVGGVFVWNLFQTKKSIIMSFIAGVFIGIIPFIKYLITTTSHIILSIHTITSEDISIFSKLKQIFFFFSPHDQLHYIFRDRLIESNFFLSIFSALLFITIFMAGIFLIYKKHMLGSALIISMVTYFCLILVVSKLGSMHHRFAILPIPQLILLLGLQNMPTRLFRAGASIVVFLYLGLFISTYHSFLINANSSCGDRAYSCNIYQLAENVGRSELPIIVNDWGISLPLLFINKTEILDISFATNEDSQEILSTLPQSFLLIQHTENYTEFKQSKKTMSDFLLNLNCVQSSIQEMYELHACEKKARP